MPATAYPEPDLEVPRRPPTSEPPPPERGGGGGGDGGGSRGPADGGGPLVDSGRLGLWLLLASLIMLFSGLGTACLVLRFSSPGWPPAGVPRLPGGLWVTTGLIVLSSASMGWAGWARRQLDPAGLRTALTVTLALGTAFLGGQAYLWSRLTDFGMPMQSSIYAATFYLVSGIHALHVVAGVVWLARVTLSSWRAEPVGGRVALCATYWHFVGIAWLALFGLLYL